MKKIIKICAGASALIAGCGAFVAKPVINDVNAIETIPSGEIAQVANAQGNFAFKAVKMPKTVNADEKEKLFIPYPSVSDDSYTIKVNVKDGKNVYSYTIGDSVEETDPFELATEGVNFKYYRNTTYKVYFTAENATEIFYSSMYDVNVKGVKYSYDVADIKTRIPSIAGVGDVIELPVLALLDANGDPVLDGEENPIVATPTVKKGTTLIVVSDTGALRYTEGKYYLHADELGTYTVSYSTEGYSVVSQQIDIDVESWFDSSKVELDVKSMTLSNVDLNVEKTLPTAEVSDLTHTYPGSTNIPHNTIITIFDEDGKTVETLRDDKIGSYKFAKTGTYSLEYKVTSLYVNNQKEAIEYIKNVVVSDRTAPEVFIVDNYDTTVDNWEENIVKLDASAIPSRVGLGHQDEEHPENNTPSIILPAIYAEDAGSKYGEINFSRVVIAPDGTETKVEGEANEAVEYTFETKGTYTIEYRAVDDAGRSTPLKFKVKVIATEALDYTENTNLFIELPTINNEMYSNEVKTVKVSSAKDDEDEAIETHYYFYFGNEQAFKDAYNSNKPADATVAYNFKTLLNSTFGQKLNELDCTDNKLTIDIEKAYNEGYAALPEGEKDTMAKQFTLVAVAINDQGQFVYDTEEVGIKDAVNDNDAPTMTMSGEFEASYIVGEDTEAILPIASFADTKSNDLKIFAQYYIVDKNGEASELTEFSTFYVGNSIGGTIALSKAGRYYVVYTAIDNANNSYDYVTSFVVENKVTYRIDVEYTNTIDVFGSTEINAYVYDNENNKIETPVTIKFNSSASPKKSGTEYTFKEAGDYTFVATATYAGQEIKSGIMTIKVNELEYKWSNSAELSVSVDLTGTVGEVVNIKIPTYTYGDQVLPAEVKVVDPNGDEVEVTYKTVNGVVADATFTPSVEGKYTTKFVAGEKESDPIYTYVGDRNRPTISIMNKDSIPSEITYNDEDITLTLTNPVKLDESTSQYNIYKVTLKATSNSGEIFNRDVKVKLFDINGSGASVPLTWSDAVKNGSIKLNGKSSESSASFKWTISSKGDYDLTIIATDTNGRDSYEETVSFKVVEKSAVKEKKDNKAGIVLIIVALVLLAGIISFFAFAGKSPKSKKIKPVKVEEKKEDEKDNQ